MTTIERVQQYQDQINDLKARVEVMNASRAGIRIESRIRDRSVMYDWTYCKEPTWDWAIFEYRIVPKPKIVPWTRDNVPFIASYRAKGSLVYQEWFPIAKGSHGLYFKHSYLKYEELAERCEYTTDGKTWKPCHKYEN